MRTYPKQFFLTLVLILALVPFFEVAAQGSSFSDAEDITGSGEKTCVYCSDCDHYYKYYLQLEDGASIIICVYPSDSLDVDLYVYNYAGSSIGSSTNVAGQEDCVEVTGPYDGYVYIRVYHYQGEGYYNLRIGDHAADPDDTCGSSGGGGSGGGGSGGSDCSSVFGWCNCCDNDNNGQFDSCDDCNPSDPTKWGNCICCNIVCPIWSVWNMITAVFSQLGQFIWNGINSIKSFFEQIGQAIQQGINAIANFFSQLGQSIMSGVNSIVQFFTDLASSIAQFFGGLGSAIMSGINSIAGFFSNLAASIVQGAQAIGSAIGSFFASIGAAISSFFQSLWQGLQSVFQGIGQGLGDAGNWLGQNWLLLIGIVLVVFGIFTNGALTIVGAIILMAYALSTGQINWGMLLVAIGCVILGFALRR